MPSVKGVSFVMGTTLSYCIAVNGSWSWRAALPKRQIQIANFAQKSVPALPGSSCFVRPFFRRREFLPPSLPRNTVLRRRCCCSTISAKSLCRPRSTVTCKRARDHACSWRRSFICFTTSDKLHPRGEVNDSKHQVSGAAHLIRSTRCCTKLRLERTTHGAGKPGTATPPLEIWRMYHRRIR